jgi:hypothetical protein
MQHNWFTVFDLVNHETREADQMLLVSFPHFESVIICICET